MKYFGRLLLRISSLAFLQDRSGAAALEFAIGSLVFLISVFFVINIGAFAFTDYSLGRAVGIAARAASIQASVDIAAKATSSGKKAFTSADCPDNATIQQYFDQALSSVWIPGNAKPSVTVAWWGTMSPCSAGTSGNVSSTVPGGGVTVTATTTWTVIAGGLFGVQQFPLTATQTMPVILSSSS
jgi:Flp pilus assembly protein TadG